MNYGANQIEMAFIFIYPSRWLETALSKTYSLMDHYNHSLSVDAKIMVSTNCPIIGEEVAVNFVAQ